MIAFSLRWCARALLLLLPLATGAAAEESPSAPPAEASDSASEQPEKELFTGKVVKLIDALKERGIEAYEKEMREQVALQTPEGELIPILSDWRGRALFQDERLRNRKVELVGYRRPGIPYLQVLMIFTFDEKGERQYTDYWCDICSIPMYEIKECECCQGPIRLRFQKQDLPDYIKQLGE